MVDGAHIFISKSARINLEQRGLVVVRDSSANKGGVITSSYEILAGLVCDEAEFGEIKEDYVEQTIDKLREMASDEAKALIEAWNRRGRSSVLSELSMAFSVEINRLATLFESLVREIREADAHRDFWAAELQAHCPEVLVEHYSDRLETTIPEDHINAILTKRLASRMLYREGLTWCRNYVAEHHAKEVLVAYIEAQETVRHMIEGMPDDLHPNIADEIIADGTRREIVRRRLGR